MAATKGASNASKEASSGCDGKASSIMHLILFGTSKTREITCRMHAHLRGQREPKDSMVGSAEFVVGVGKSIWSQVMLSVGPLLMKKEALVKQCTTETTKENPMAAHRCACADRVSSLEDSVGVLAISPTGNSKVVSASGNVISTAGWDGSPQH